MRLHLLVIAAIAITSGNCEIVNDGRQKSSDLTDGRQENPGDNMDYEDIPLNDFIMDILQPFIGEYGPALRGLINSATKGMGVVEFVKLVGNRVFNGTAVEMNFGSSLPMADRKVLSMFEFLSGRLDQLEHGVIGIEESLRRLGEGTPSLIRWEIAMETLGEYIGQINAFYRRFIFYQSQKEQVEDHTLQDFAESVVGHDMDSVMSLMALVHGKAVPQPVSLMGIHDHSTENNPKEYYEIGSKVSRKMKAKYKQIMHNRGLPTTDNSEQSQQYTQASIFQMLSDVLQDYDICSLKQSPAQLINGLYLKVALAEARAYSMMSFAWMLLRVYNEGNFTAEQQYGEETYLQYSADILKEAHSVMLKASNEFRLCDPKVHSEGETFVQLTELLQGVIENEVDMNPSGTCQSNCGYYEHARSEGCFYSEVQYCGKHRRCGGTLHHCGFYDADAHVCKSRNPYRRYDWILYENHVRLGPQGSCKGDQIKVDSWWRWFVHCSYCFCMCDDGNSNTTDRFVSLVPVLSDTQKNMVVTGIKFTKQKRVIHMKIQQGQALPQGQINGSTLHWQDVEPINIKSSAYQDGVHYKKLSYEERNVDLDRLMVIESHVVTGVRFRMLGGHINLEAQITPINFTTGELQPFKSYWISNDNTPAMAKNPRREINIGNLDIPTRYPGSTKIDSTPDTFIRFGPSSITQDAAQSTIPFFDAQSVAPVPASWLSGVELYHKGRRGTGGFLGLQVMTYNTSQHIEDLEEHKVVITGVVETL